MRWLARYSCIRIGDGPGRNGARSKEKGKKHQGRPDRSGNQALRGVFLQNHQVEIIRPKPNGNQGKKKAGFWISSARPKP
ncbi:hypothetical protein EBT23_02065 [bacterium]|nr:hypothetical protein [bacterium]